MLTKINPDGTWSCRGIDLKEVSGNVYGALCRLHDYEKIGLNPDDFIGDGYENLRLYKVLYNEFTGSERKQILCESKESAEIIADSLKRSGFINVIVNNWGWQVLLEK